MKRACLLALVLVGCGGSQELMPLQVGNSWRYSVSAGFKDDLTEVRVVRVSSVAGVEGVVLTGPMGESHLAWKGDTLIAERFSNTTFKPAVPLLVNSDRRTRETWRGKAMGIWGQFEGTGTLNQAPAEEQIGGQRIKGIKTELTILNPKGKNIRLQTMFQPGFGVVSQRQWVGGDQVISIERLGGLN